VRTSCDLSNLAVMAFPFGFRALTIALLLSMVDCEIWEPWNCYTSFNALLRKPQDVQLITHLLFIACYNEASKLLKQRNIYSRIPQVEFSSEISVGGVVVDF
jgi:hypothetical protein